MRRPTSIAAACAALAACSAGGVADSPSTMPESAVTSTESPASTGTPNRPPPPLPWGPTRAEYDEAAAIVADMSTAERAGQVIVAHYGGTSAPTELVERYHLGGVIVMGENVESPDQVREMISDLQDGVDRPHALIVGVDQEGGRVARVREPATEFPSLMTLGASRDGGLTADVTRASGLELRAMGFTMVFAPDADVTSGPDDPTIGTRAASSDPDVAARIVNAAVRGYADAGILPVAKHFPGHGSVPADSHVELPVQSASVAELQRRDFVPFQAAIAAGVPAVMVAHLDLEAVDPGVPSSVSPAVVSMLRDDLGFAGVIVTDAQDMAGLAGLYDAADAAVRSLTAGADIVLMPADIAAAHAGIVAAVESGRLDPARLADAATRAVALSIHQAAAGPPPDADVVGSHSAESYAASLAGMTVVDGPCEGRLVGDAIRVVGGDATDRNRLADAARAAGLAVGTGDVVRLLGALPPEPGSGDVVVSLDTPYALADSTATTAKIALYSRTPDAFRALVDVLTGAETAAGRLPVDVPGVERDGCPPPR
ncbi:MAG TPA: glycoside hydrolase family 3 N-terminal domain-containing protein [Jiangellaceae bacterium]